MIKGIDLSNHNAERGPVDFVAVKADGISFCFLKATEGVDFVDASVHEFAAGCASAGLDFGFYHFATPGGSRNSSGGYTKWWDAADEAADFLRALATLPPATCFPILDFEWAGMNECLPSYDDRARWCNEWIEAVSAEQVNSLTRARARALSDPTLSSPDTRALGGPLVQFYANPAWLGRVTLPDSLINACPLWYARYTSAPPPFDEVWGWENYWAWQYTDDGSVDGVTGRVDLISATSLDAVLFDVEPEPEPEAYSSRIDRSVRRIRREADELALVASQLRSEGL